MKYIHLFFFFTSFILFWFGFFSVSTSLDASLYRVVAGEHNIYEYDGTEQIMAVEHITVHPDWNEDLAKG